MVDGEKFSQPFQVEPNGAGMLTLRFCLRCGALIDAGSWELHEDSHKGDSDGR